MLLAPPLQRLVEYAALIEAGLASSPPPKEWIDEAISFSQQGEQLFLVLKPCILRTEAVLEIIHQIELEQKAQLASLRNLSSEQTSLTKASGEITQTYTRLHELYAKLRTEESKEHLYSPYPQLDQTIRVGINHLDGHAQIEDLQMRLDVVASVVYGLEQSIRRFQLLYSQDASQPLVAKPLEQVQHLQAGLGALSLYCQTRDQSNLKDALRLLGAASVKLADLLPAFDKHRQENTKYSPIAYLEELARSIDVPSDSQRAATQTAWVNVLAAVNHLKSEQHRLTHHPLRFLAQTKFEHFSGLCQQIPALPSEPVNAPKEFLLNTGALLAQVEQALADLTAAILTEEKVSNLPSAFSQLRELIGLANNQMISSDYFQEELSVFADRQQTAAESFPAESSDPVDQEMGSILETHRSAFENLLSSEPNYLESWQQVANTLERFVQLQELIKERAGLLKPKSTSKFVLCFRCGKENPTSEKYCQGCRAVLPQISQEVAEYTDITAPPQESEQALPSNLAKIQSLFEQFERQELSEDDYYRELQAELKSIDKARHTFDRQVVSQMGKDADFDSYANFFALQVGQMSQGIQSMIDSIGTPHQRQGLQQYLQAGLQLQGFNQKIQSALRS